MIIYSTEIYELLIQFAFKFGIVAKVIQHDETIVTVEYGNRRFW